MYKILIFLAVYWEKFVSNIFIVWYWIKLLIWILTTTGKGVNNKKDIKTHGETSATIKDKYPSIGEGAEE